jgi:hypothetical protein
MADDLDSASGADKEFINVDYGVNGAALTTDLGDILSGTSRLTFGSGAGVSGKNLGLRLNLNRGGTNTNTPKIKDIVVEGVISPEVSYEHQLIIDIKETAINTGLNVETVISNLETAINSVTQVNLSFGQVSKNVTIDRTRSQFSYRIDADGWSGAPDANAQRHGLRRNLVPDEHDQRKIINDISDLKNKLYPVISEVRRMAKHKAIGWVGLGLGSVSLLLSSYAAFKIWERGW